jgi:hypothetical protein
MDHALLGKGIWARWDAKPATLLASRTHDKLFAIPHTTLVRKDPLGESREEFCAYAPVEGVCTLVDQREISFDQIAIQMQN